MKKDSLFCKSISFIGLPHLIEELGGSPERLFAKVGLDLSHAKNGDNFYEWGKACTLLELAAAELSEPHLGLKWAHAVPKDFLNSGPMIMLGGLSPTVRDFATLAQYYQKLHTNGVSYEYSFNEDTSKVDFEIRVHPLSPPCRQFIEHIMGNCFLMERHYIDKAKFSSVSFQHNAAQDLSWHEKTFQCPVIFNADKVSTQTHIDFFDVPLSGRLKSLRPIVKMYLDRKLNTHTRYNSTLSDDIEKILPSILGVRKSNMTDLAKFLEISPKKLQRLLNDEGVTYSEIIDNVKKAMTQRLLFESDISITHLALTLDYTSNEAFNTASKRWFGRSPRQYRQDIRATTHLT